MKESKKQLLQEIKEQLKLGGASTGEICTELLRLEKVSMEGLNYYLEGLKRDIEEMKPYNYIGNAKIIDINELPKINEEHDIYKSIVCIEVKIVDFQEDYIIYQAEFCEKESLHMLDDFRIDCCHWSYAVKKVENINK